MIPDLAIKRWQHGFRRASKDSVRMMGEALRKHHRILELERTISSADTQPGVER